MSLPDPYATTPDYTAAAGVTVASPVHAPAPAGQVTFGMPQQPAPKPGRSSTMLALGIVGICIAGLAGLLVLGYLLLAVGPVVMIVGGIIGRILEGKLEAGSALPSERFLAEEFGVNRHAVREALKRLEQAGL